MKSTCGTYFNNPNLERDMTVTGHVFDLADAGFVSFVGGGNLKRFMESEGFKDGDSYTNWIDFEERARDWTKKTSDTLKKKKLRKALAMGALDVAGSLPGPI